MVLSKAMLKISMEIIQLVSKPTVEQPDGIIGLAGVTYVNYLLTDCKIFHIKNLFCLLHHYHHYNPAGT